MRANRAPGFLGSCSRRRWHTGLGGHRALGGTQPTQPRVGHSQYSLRKGHTQFGTHRACKGIIQTCTQLHRHSPHNPELTTRTHHPSSSPSGIEHPGGSEGGEHGRRWVEVGVFHGQRVQVGHELEGREGAHGLAEGGRASSAGNVGCSTLECAEVLCVRPLNASIFWFFDPRMRRIFGLSTL